MLGLCCLTLVVWTVIVTASPLPEPEPGEQWSQVKWALDIYISGAEGNGLNGTNSSIASSVCPLNASLDIDSLSFSLR